MSNVNPLGYGHPLVGLFRADGSPIVFGSSDNSHLPNVISEEHTFILKSCDIENDEEEGTSGDLKIEMNHQGLVDSPHFHHGNKLIVRIGYLSGESIYWGAPFHLIVMNKRVSYEDTIILDLELVDEKIYISRMVSSEEEQEDVLNRVEDAVMQVENKKLDDDEINRYKKIYDHLSLTELYTELHKIRLNIIKRYGSHHFRYENLITYSLDEFKEGLQRIADSRNFPAVIRGARKILRMTDEEIFDKYARENTRKSMRFFFQSARDNSNWTDLYGFTFCHEGEKKWLSFLQESGVLNIARSRYSNARFASIFYKYGRLDQDKIDEFIKYITDEWVLNRVKEDMNKSKINNIETYLRTMIDGPHILKDDADGEGLHVQKRNLDALPYQTLTYRGGTGDLLKVTVETNYEEPEFSSTEVSDIDPETGQEVVASHINYNQTDGISLGGPKAYIDTAIQSIRGGKPIPPMSDFDQYVELVPFRVMDTGYPSYLKDDLYYTAAVDRTRVVKNLPPIKHLQKPLSIEEVLAEIDNRRGDANLKRILAHADLLGNPNIRSGMVFVLNGVNKRFSGRYYTLAANHSVDAGSGYKTTLYLGKIPPEEVRALVTEKKEQEVEPERRHWRYLKSGRVVEVRQTGEFTGVWHRGVRIGDPGHSMVFIDSKPAWYDAENNMIWPLGFDPKHFSSTLKEIREKEKAKDESFRSLLGVDAEFPEITDEEVRQIWESIPRETIRQERLRDIFKETDTDE